MTKITHREGIVALALVLIVGTALVTTVRASGSKYSFTARGIITSVDEANKTIDVDITKATGKGKDDLEGTNIEIVVEKAKVVKVISSKDKRVTYHNFAVGQEVGLKGTAKDDDTFHATFARIHDRSFTVVGLLQEHNETTKTLEILVTTSSYKPSTYKKGDTITMSYTDESKFRNTSTEVVFSDVDANNQKVKVQGTIENASSWKVKTLWDNYTGK